MPENPLFQRIRNGQRQFSAEHDAGGDYRLLLWDYVVPLRKLQLQRLVRLSEVRFNSDGDSYVGVVDVVSVTSHHQVIDEERTGSRSIFSRASFSVDDPD